MALIAHKTYISLRHYQYQATFNGKIRTYSVATEELSLVIQHNLIEGLCLLLLVAMIKTMTKTTTGRKVFPPLKRHSFTGQEGRNPDAGPEAAIME